MTRLACVSLVAATLGCEAETAPAAPSEVALPADRPNEQAEPASSDGGGVSRPPAPPPTAPFAAGDVIPEGLSREPTGATGHAAFDGGVPIPWRCEVVGRTKTTIAARCDVSSGQARSFYQRLHRGFGRDMFGGVWAEEEEFAYYDRPIEKTTRIHISADRDRALYGAATSGAPLRVHGEPEGRPRPDPAPGAASHSADDLFLRSFGQWSCGSRDVFIGVRRIVIGNARTDAVCGAVRIEGAGAGQIRVKCSGVTGDHEEVLGAGEAARLVEQGLVIGVGPGSALSFDGAACRRSSRRR
ncbi:MAG: hypothetical protein HYY06_19075 [Deltaproteobacteria bacterium]|nr:hypothetical protein [Deltaproteobacteria bacterium]